MVSETQSIDQCSNTVCTVWSRTTVFSWVRLASSVKPTNNWSDLRSLPLDKSEIFHQQKISMSEASTVWCIVSVSTVDLGNHCPFLWNFLERWNLSMIYIKSGFRSFLWTSALGSEFWPILEGHHAWPLFFCFMLSEHILLCYKNPSLFQWIFIWYWSHFWNPVWQCDITLLPGYHSQLVWTSVFWVKTDFMKMKNDRLEIHWMGRVIFPGHSDFNTTLKETWWTVRL